MTPAFLTDGQIAKRLNRSKNWMSANRRKLERAGFPRVDAMVGLTCSEDVEAWIANRRQFPTIKQYAKPRNETEKGDDLGLL